MWKHRYIQQPMSIPCTQQSELNFSFLAGTQHNFMMRQWIHFDLCSIRPSEVSKMIEKVFAICYTSSSSQQYNVTNFMHLVKIRGSIWWQSEILFLQRSAQSCQTLIQINRHVQNYISSYYWKLCLWFWVFCFLVVFFYLQFSWWKLSQQNKMKR